MSATMIQEGSEPEEASEPPLLEGPDATIPLLDEAGPAPAESAAGAHAGENAVRPALWMLAGAFAFAVMGACTSGLSTRCDWRVTALWRAVAMFGLALGMARVKGVKLHFSRPRTLWIRSVAGSISLVCSFYALSRLPVADALTLTNMYPLWIVLLSSLLFGLLPTGPELAAILCGMAGVALIEQPSLSGNSVAIVAAIVGSCTTSVALLGLHRLRHVDARAIVTHFAGVASVLMIVWLVVEGRTSFGGRWDATTFALLAGVGVTGTAGQFLLTKAYSAGLPTRLSAVGLTQVVFALFFDVTIWGRQLTAPAVAGFILVLAPTAWLSARAGSRLSFLGRKRGKLEN